MNDNRVASKIRHQLKQFLGELLPHFSKPKVAFLGNVIYGLIAGGDIKLSKICRTYRPTITMKKAGDRLCMHLNDTTIEKSLHEFIAKKVARSVRSDTLIIVDPSDIQKPYASQMDFLSKVWDGLLLHDVDRQLRQTHASREKHHGRITQNTRTSRLSFLRNCRRN